MWKKCGLKFSSCSKHILINIDLRFWFQLFFESAHFKASYLTVLRLLKEVPSHLIFWKSLKHSVRFIYLDWFLWCKASMPARLYSFSTVKWKYSLLISFIIQDHQSVWMSMYELIYTFEKYGSCFKYALYWLFR